MQVELWSPDRALAHSAEVFSVYDDVFGDRTNEDDWRTEMFERHCAREGYRFAAALDAGRLVGFAWGYAGQRGQYWSHRAVTALPREVSEEWVGGHFEFVELAVLATARGAGLGGRLHDVLLAGVAQSRALLSTDNFDSPATRLYTRRGWHKLGELDPDTQVMGLLLPRAGQPVSRSATALGSDE